MIIARAPFRISFFGGGTDFPEYYRRHGGAVLLTAIDRCCYLAVHRLSAFYPHRFRASYSQTETTDSVDAIRHPLIRECLRAAAPDDRLEITHIADLPGGTGLGTSSSFTVGLLHALRAARGEDPTPEALAREAIRIERERVGDPGGHQDQYAAAFGGWLRLDFRPDGAVEARRLELDAARRARLEAALLLFYTGSQKSAHEVLRRQSAALARNLDALDEMRDLTDRAEIALRSGGPLERFGALLDRAWSLKRSLAEGISFPEVDAAYAKARELGAWGGKLLGAGGRGFLMILAPPEQQPAIEAALAPWPAVRVRGGADGSRIVYRDPS